MYIFCHSTQTQGRMGPSASVAGFGQLFFHVRREYILGSQGTIQPVPSQSNKPQIFRLSRLDHELPS